MSDSFVIETAADGNTPIRYSCQELLTNNQATFLSVEYYYDIMYTAGEDEASVVAKAESDLLSKVASNFGLVSGERCSIPPVSSLWVVEVTSKPDDQFMNVFESCQELVPASGQACSVYKGHMEAYYLGEADPSALENYIQQNLNSAGKQTYETAYLGAQLDTSLIGSTNAGATNNLNPAMNQAEAPANNNNDKGKRTVTFVGGLLVAGFLAAFLGLFFVLYRRRQKFLSGQNVEIALSKSDMDDNGSMRDQKQQQQQRREYPHSHHHRNNSNDYDQQTPEELEPEIGDEYDEEYGSNNYTFDLGNNMKNELFNIHGRAGDYPSRQYGIGIEETSDSDADSWAQTDGTIGSLEQQLEPITAEV